MRTYEEICLEKLKEIGIATAREWSVAMGYENPNALAKVIRRIIRTTPERLIVMHERKPRQYKTNDN
ncbi:MAG: hypothetical protein ACTSRT_00065 [Promethearchaeota archaeon]